MKSSRRKGGYFHLEIERGGFRGGEVGWCTPALGGCRGEGGGAKVFFFRAEMSTKLKLAQPQVGLGQRRGSAMVSARGNVPGGSTEVRYAPGGSMPS